MTKPKTYKTFELLGTKNIPAINATVELYKHKITGAMHVHIASENTENVFNVMFRTMPTNSNGVAHILEHTALCGSEKYPVRDPFFSMVRRSLNSFMNAMTSNDWTAYPFASPNKKDFNNLLNIYLDATFFPLLEEVDFMQEGHRVEFKTPEDKSSELEFKGVVFNEMKGAMSSPNSVVYQELQTILYPDTTYEVNSGGEPADIPSLTYKQFVDFHKTHYHPSNAIFMTFGDITAVEHQENFEEKVLKRFKKAGKSFSVPNVKRFNKPKTKHIKYAFDEDDTTKKTYIQMGWLLGSSVDSYEVIKVDFLERILVGDSSSPLLEVLEKTKLGTTPNYCGFSGGDKEMLFMLGLQGSEVKDAEKVENLILDTLNEVAINGVSTKRIESILDSMEADMRDLESGSNPLGLSFMYELMTHAVHGGDLLNVLNIEPLLNKLRVDALKPDFVQNLVKNTLLNNKHRATIIAEPDTNLSSAKNKAECDVLAKMKASMTDTEMDTVINNAKILKARQEAVDDISCLPTVTMADILTTKIYPKGNESLVKKMKSTFYSAGTNGIIRQKVVVDLPKLTERQLQILPYYASIVTEIGVANRSYLEVGEWQTSICSHFYASVSILNVIGNTDAVDAYVTFTVGGLQKRSPEMVDMIVETFNNVSFKEHERIKDIVSQKKTSKENSITGNGHGLASGCASHGMSAGGDISFKLGGLESIKFAKELDKSLADKNSLAKFAEELSELHNLIRRSTRQTMVVAENEKADIIAKELATASANMAFDHTLKGFKANKVDKTVNDMWVVNTQVNFCAKAYKTVPSTHEDSAPLRVLASYMKNNFIHTAIREKGGAYGGMVNYSSSNASFTFVSYRDPRLGETLNDYDKAIDWMKTATHEQEKVCEAIFGIISSIDAPNTPIANACGHFSSVLHGRTNTIRSDYRKRILAVTVADLVRVANKYLNPSKANVTVITSKEMLKKEGDLGLNVTQL